MNSPYEKWTPNSDYRVKVRRYPDGQEHIRIEPTDGQGKFDHGGIARCNHTIIEVIEKITSKPVSQNEGSRNMEDYGNYVRHDYPKAMVEIARKRVKGLLKYNIISCQPLEKLLESAYMQGICDASDAIALTVKTEPRHE